MNENILFYTKPADRWTEALPIGNGKLGAMVFGGIYNERIQINEESVWSGGPRDRNNPDSYKNLEAIRKLLSEGKIEEAQKLTRYSMTAMPEWQRSYQTLGNIDISINGLKGKTENYTRVLDLNNAVTDVRYEINGYTYKREVFASVPANIIAVRLETDNPEGLSFDVRCIRERYNDKTVKTDDKTIAVYGHNGDVNGISYCAMMTCSHTGGEACAIGEFLVFKNVNEATLYITAATSFNHKDFNGVCQSTLKSVLQKSYKELMEEHVSVYQSFYKKMSLSLSNDKNSITAGDKPDAENNKLQQKYPELNNQIPTDERLNEFKKSFNDTGLIELYFNFGRYLLISCSHPDSSLPANLQGIWCGDYMPAWDSKFTININAQMNYWPAESANLSECHMPFFKHIRRMYENGKDTARIMYNCSGFVAHHNTDIWGDTAPQDSYTPATYWVMGAAWMCLHIWEHYEYTLNTDFLKENFYLLKDACQFFIDYLVENNEGELIISPTVSPENSYIIQNGATCHLSEGCAMDSQILRELFESSIKAGRIIGAENELINTWQNILSKIPEPKIGKNGTILEWMQEVEEAELGHRHISHLFALFPGNHISVSKTPDLAMAARKTLERRLSHGGGHTGWSRAWITNFWAKLQDSKLAEENINLLLSNSTLPNLFDNHPPFQIDGNFGGIAAITNMFLQSSENEVLLLPALPDKWKNGFVDGIKAKGGLTVDLKWEDSKLTYAKISAAFPYEGFIFYKGKKENIKLSANESYFLK